MKAMALVLKGLDMDAATAAIELHAAVDQGVQCVIGTLADALAGKVLVAHLSNENASRSNLLAAKPLHTAVLGIAVTSVSAGTLAFFVCHGNTNRQKTSS